jgi:hypothetical protein
MKVYIGPYRDWFGPYQLADLLQKVGVSKDTCYKIGQKLAGDEPTSAITLSTTLKRKPTVLARFLEWVHSKKKRKVKIKLHAYDTWNMDSTLSIIILPMLKQLKETKHGSPCVDDADVPEHLRSTMAAPKENEWDTDSLFHDRWEWVIHEMIWAFEQLQPDFDWETQYYSGESDILFKKTEDGSDTYQMKIGPNDTRVFDAEGYKQHNERIQRGLILFGKYYRSLWD